MEIWFLRKNLWWDLNNLKTSNPQQEFQIDLWGCGVCSLDLRLVFECRTAINYYVYSAKKFIEHRFGFEQTI